MQRQKSRLKAAFLISPLVFGGVVLVFSLLTGATGGVWFFLFSSLIAYVLTAIVGFPIYIFLTRFKLVSLSIYLSVAFLISIIPIGYFLIYPAISLYQSGFGQDNFSWVQIKQSLLIIVACIVTVSVFWIIARPDLADKSSN